MAGSDLGCSSIPSSASLLKSDRPTRYSSSARSFGRVRRPGIRQPAVATGPSLSIRLGTLQPVAYRIEYDPAAEDHLARLNARDEATRKRLRANAFAPWELRIGVLRVYYEVTEKPERLVTVRAVGVKDRSHVTIGGEEIDVS